MAVGAIKIKKAPASRPDIGEWLEIWGETRARVRDANGYPSMCSIARIFEGGRVPAGSRLPKGLDDMRAQQSLEYRCIERVYWQQAQHWDEDISAAMLLLHLFYVDKIDRRQAVKDGVKAHKWDKVFANGRLLMVSHVFS